MFKDGDTNTLWKNNLYNLARNLYPFLKKKIFDDK